MHYTLALINRYHIYIWYSNIKDLNVVLNAEMVRKARSHNKVQSVSSQDTQNYHSAQDIADVFLNLYYECLKDFPEDMHKFYKEGSTVSIPVDDGSIQSMTTIKVRNYTRITSNQILLIC